MIPAVVVFILMLVFKSGWLEFYGDWEQSTSLALGFILLFAALFGKQVSRLKLPQITGFIAAGILCGPYVLKFLSLTDVHGLQLFDGLALSLIALTAGGEMRIPRLRGSWKAIGTVVFSQTLVIMAGFMLLGWIGRSFLPFFAGMTSGQSLAYALLLGTLATATSPSTTIAVLTESQAAGRCTDLILSAAVVKDFFVIMLFAFSLSLAESLSTPELGIDFMAVLHVLKDIGVSVLIGLAVGGGIILYLKFIRREMTIFILSIAFFTYQITHGFGFHPLLICLIAGFMVQNVSAQGDSLIQAIEKISLPVYVVFFAISGASLDLGALRAGWLFALVYVVWRGALKFVGTYWGSRWSRQSREIRRFGWAGFISQAGVALGMAIIIEDTFPSWGGEFKTLVLAVIAVNQIVGPVLLQKLLIKVGEAGKKIPLKPVSRFALYGSEEGRAAE